MKSIPTFILAAAAGGVTRASKRHAVAPAIVLHRHSTAAPPQFHGLGRHRPHDGKSSRASRAPLLRDDLLYFDFVKFSIWLVSGE